MKINQRFTTLAAVAAVLGSGALIGMVSAGNTRYTMPPLAERTVEDEMRIELAKARRARRAKMREENRQRSMKR